MIMKKYITTLVMAGMMAVTIPLLADTASAQTRRYYNSRTRTYTTYKRPNVYQRHRKAFNLGIGTAAGALIGGLIGGKRGAVIGGLAGVGGGALFHHKQRPQNYLRPTNNRNNRRVYNQRNYRRY